ncbi:ubiquitin carboxyl-terminal hydrolase isozyme L3-like [Venturia canescens]|uniref:ubiquitin carboxyl-terminal hydrolase isozyme L3-like n=1 Tax=Venturia canescens TaxID=32260 RepID=UPI001C9D3CCF|nr:ubiquitin carboxyl-terminal hydrolase isozyme L3-like [Venturia canescens]
MAWVPLESNPEVMTKFAHQLGVPKKWGFVDVYGTDPVMLALVPKPVLALILLYPLSSKTSEYDAEEAKKIEESGQKVSSTVYHLKQCVSNACGTVALVHSIANNTDEIQLEDGFMKKFIADSLDCSFEDRGQLLIKEGQGIGEAHEKMAQEGQTAAPPVDQPVYHHFVAFVHKDGSLYELDGSRPTPINHGPSTKETLLEDAAEVCKAYMSRVPKEVRFTMVALVPNE